MAHVAELDDDRLGGHLELLDHGGEGLDDRVDDDSVLGTLLQGREERRLGPAVRVRVPTACCRPGEGQRGDPVRVPRDQQLGCGTDEAVDGERRAGRMQRPEPPEEVRLTKGPVGVDCHLTGEDELVEAPGCDFGQRSADTVQEVLVGSGRGEPEFIRRWGLHT